MATASQPYALEANPIEEILSIRVDQIDIGERLRPIDTVWAAALGAIMAKHGQQMPIEVCRLPGVNTWRLVTGAHRVAGARAESIEHLHAIEVGPNLAERRMREVSENLWRRDLDPIDRAAFVAELVTLHKEKAGIDPTKDGRSASANARWKKDAADEADDARATMSLAYGWNDQVAEAIGVSTRTIKRDLLLYRGLAPSVVEKLRSARHPVATNSAQLSALTKLTPHEQSAVADRLIAGTSKAVPDAIAQLRGTNLPVPPESKRFNAALGMFKRMPAAERLALFQSPLFHALMPAEARTLLAPMCRDGQAPQEEAEDVDNQPQDQDRAAAGLGGYGRSRRSDGHDAIREHSDRRGEGRGERVDPVAVGIGQDVLGTEAAADGRRPQLSDNTHERPTPAVAIRASVKPDYIACLECGERLKMLKRHLTSVHQTTSDEYFAKWRLPRDYPLVAPQYAEERRALAKKIGLGGSA